MNKISSKSEVFEFSGEAEALEGCMWPAMPIFKFGWANPVKSHKWKFGSDWLSLSRVIVVTNPGGGGGGRNPLLGWGGYMWPVMPIFEHDRAIPVKNRVWKFGSDWLSLSRVIVATNKNKNNK